jgi:hypothetical protein
LSDSESEGEGDNVRGRGCGRRGCSGNKHGCGDDGDEDHNNDDMDGISEQQYWDCSVIEIEPETHEDDQLDVKEEEEDGTRTIPNELGRWREEGMGALLLEPLAPLSSSRRLQPLPRYGETKSGSER